MFFVTEAIQRYESPAHGGFLLLVGGLTISLTINSHLYNYVIYSFNKH
jgi:hypothetical protein